MFNVQKRIQKEGVNRLAKKSRKKSKKRKRAKGSRKRSKRSRSSKKRSKKSVSKKAKKRAKRRIRKKSTKKALKRTKKAGKAIPELMKKKIGEITHFYTHISVAVVRLDGELRKGDNILIEGSTTHIKQKAESMQINRQDIDVAKKGQEIGLMVKDRAREGDIVYKI